VAGRLVYCRLCDVGYASISELPKVCPSCERPTKWTTMPPYKLNEDDRLFLKLNRIRQD
jgi:hypothetical protein